MYRYFAYGLVIESALDLPGLLAHDGDSERQVRIRFGAVDSREGGADERGIRFQGDAQDATLDWPGVGAARVVSGTDIVVSRTDGGDGDALRALVLGPGLGILLNQRGLTALHASAVAVDGEATAFLGGSGWGKSTIAAALHRRGHPVIADDIVAVALASGSATVLPAHPHLKLSSDVLEQLGGRPAELAQVYRGNPKRLFPVSDRFWADPLPLGRLYVLQIGDRVAIRAVRPHEAAVEFVRHSWGIGVLHALAPAEYLERCTRLASQVPVLRLARPGNLDDLGLVAELIERDVLGQVRPS